MRARDKAITWLKKLRKGQCEEDFVDSIIEAVKEDLATPGKEFDHLWEGAYEIPPTKPCSNCGPTKAVVYFNPKTKCCTECGKQVSGFGQVFAEQPELKPSLIRGLTAKQWQEIIDGGYLCEFSFQVDFEMVIHSLLFGFGRDHEEETDFFHPVADKTNDFRYCRPAQIKGVMRPIFVEPVDKDSHCVFFNDDAEVVFTGIYRFLCDSVKIPTKYIEL